MKGANRRNVSSVALYLEVDRTIHQWLGQLTGQFMLKDFLLHASHYAGSQGSKVRHKAFCPSWTHIKHTENESYLALSRLAHRVLFNMS